MIYRSIKDLLGYDIEATDGHVRSVDDFLFDDDLWKVRYMVANTGNWLPGRQVLISPEAASEPEWDGKKIPVELTKDMIENSPPLEMDRPVSRQWERKYVPHFGWAQYWVDSNGDPTLRSVNEVTGYKVFAMDGEIGTVEDIIVDDETWDVRYLVVDTSNWNPLSKRTIIPTEWLNQFDVNNKVAIFEVKKEKVENAPEYDPKDPINRKKETVLYDFYGQPHYWK